MTIEFGNRVLEMLDRIEAKIDAMIAEHDVDHRRYLARREARGWREVK